MFLPVRPFAFAFACGLLATAVEARPQNGPAQAATDPAALGLTELTDDLSRQQLFEEIRAADAAGSPSDAERAASAIQTFNLVGPFRFPGDTTYDSALNKPRVDSFFGVDISHYTSSNFPIASLKVRNVQFLYMKTTQGAGSVDGKFAGFWKQSGDLPKDKRVHRGAYHFLSACEGSDCTSDPAKWGKAQAQTYIKVIKANGGLLPTDMPPVVDLEWDKASSSGPDRWQNRSPKAVLAMLDAFITEVRAQLHRTTMIYTARSWWEGRMKTTPMSTTMAASPLWLADYSKSSRASEVPRTIGTAKWALWQLTDSGTMATGFNGAFDANIYKGSLPALYQTLGVKAFDG
jgi:lysozyme